MFFQKSLIYDYTRLNYDVFKQKAWALITLLVIHSTFIYTTILVYENR